MSLSGNSLNPSSLGFGLNNFDPSSQSTVRQPRANVMIDGSPVNWITWETDSTGGRSDASTFRVVLPIGGTSATLPLSYFVSAQQIMVTILATPSNNSTSGLSSSGMDTLITGEVDHLSYEPDKATLTLTGRDLSAKLMDKKTSLKYQNQKASDIVTKLAGNAGLTPVVSSTQQKSGKYYQIDHARLTNQTSDWDLLQYLAREENMVTYVKGNNLHFEPQGTGPQTPYVIDLTSPGYSTTDPVGQSNAVEIELTRNFVIGKGAKVGVHSWNFKGKKKISSTATAKGNGTPLNFNYTYPNLSTEQAQTRAKSKLHDITQHEFTINIHMPADNILAPQIPVQVIGTQSEFDQIYYVKSVRREMAWNQGYVMHFEAMNQRAKNQVSST